MKLFGRLYFDGTKVEVIITLSIFCNQGYYIISSMYRRRLEHGNSKVLKILDLAILFEYPECPSL